ncbi:MAG: glycoside hydrolase family 130 protein [Acidimicrobiia bacterium]
MSRVAVRRSKHRLLPDARRVIAAPFVDDVAVPPDDSRAGLLIRRILAIPEAQVDLLLQGIRADFSLRHRAFDEILERHFELVAHRVGPTAHLSRERRLLIGAYFTHEYSVESAALFNPSMVLAPDQDNVRPGERRFVMSLRAVGEGHISSIEFRSGIIDAMSNLTFDPPGSQLVTGRRSPPSHYDKRQFRTKLTELGVGNELAWGVLARLSERFTLTELERSLALLEEDDSPPAISYETAKIIRVLAASNYVTSFPPESALAERVIFPAGPYETRGMEDARFVRFMENGSVAKYYATYTAFDGFEILPQLIETEDFTSLTISTLNGSAAQNKGMALFPRQIDGMYVMLSRKDRENLHLATSKDVRFWNDVTELYEPSKSWELRHIGNCGAPMETDAGWLVLTHGVGPMRRYAIGALLLDLEDPRRVLGHLPEPLLVPDETEREGYVPNVLYSCGGMINGDRLVLPYGFSDYGIGIAAISLPELLAELRKG